ncbi:low affinity immunoglobulin gamma Fc region receptor II-a-like [Centropristis striata]|uniref:low affinity immunoglobulin gamma Fc region receptor II-a-like n=1 Tax=Centropristis striata TaxID=184440 RepID=UPI0027E0C335|nr:low affinity immunoglobulin gamma Fc region receptor II-a-like [Centropristis striata]
MQLAALSLLLLLNSLDFGFARVSPKRSQFFKYDSFSVSCQDDGEEEEEEEEETAWTVMKRMQDGEVRPCSSSCSVSAAFPATDSGEYWCQSGTTGTSNSVNITVTGGPVILESPAVPVMEGDAVTLSCRTKSTFSSNNISADFYKDGLFISSSSTGEMTIHSVSTSDEGLYKCNVSGGGESPDGWLAVRAPPAGWDPPPPLLSVFTLVRYLVVASPYLLCTVLLGLIYRDRARAQHAIKATATSNDVIMEIAA